MAKATGRFPWQDKIINPAQLGGIETSVLDNGAGKGVRIAWVNTGAGLRYKIVIDRALDIADTFYDRHSLAWMSHAGIIAPRPDVNRGLEWLYTFTGGLLATCGLSHAGAPDVDEHGERGLHGRVGNIGARLESVVQPDPLGGNLDMSITAVINESSVFGPHLELRRTITSTLGEPVIRIRDVVTNRGPSPVPHMILYHCNFGWPLVDDGADFVWKGTCRSRGMDMDDAIFKGRHNYRKCPGPLESHSNGDEACGFIDVKADTRGMCTVGLHNRRLGLAVSIKYKKKQLPCLTNWQRWARGEYVTGLEPGTNSPIGQKAARQQKTLIQLAPGKSRTYELEIAVLSDKNLIGAFLKAGG